VAQEAELLVRVSSSAQQRFGTSAAQSSSEELKNILADKATAVRSILKIPSAPAGNTRAFTGSRPAALREWLSITLRNDSDAPEACQTLEQSGVVDACQRNFRHYVDTLPNDPLVTQDGANLGACEFDQKIKNLWGHEMIRAFEAWKSPGCPAGGCQGQGVVVGVVDSGIDYTHPDIANNLFVNPDEDYNRNGVFDPYPANQGGDLDGVDSGGNALADDVVGANFVQTNLTPYDDLGHGTHCAGTIGATAGNGIGIAGIAPQAKILTAKSISKDGYGTSEWLAQGLRYIVDTVDRDRDGKVDRPTVINNSWGSDSEYQDLILEDATKYAISKGAVVIFAAGNSAVDASKQSPNALPEAVMVAAIGPHRSRASFSNFGDRVAVAAPGGGGYPLSCSDQSRAIPDYTYNVLSLLAADSIFASKHTSLVVGGKYIRLAGTSMAAPHVVGVVALLLSQRPNLTPAQVKSILLAGTTPSADWSYSPYTGTGIVDAVKTLALPDTINLNGSFERLGSQIISGQSDYSVKGETFAPTTEVFVTTIRNYAVADRQLLNTVTGRSKGVLAVFNPRTVSVQDEIWIEMTMHSGDYSATTRRRFYFDPTLRVGYPKKVSNGLSLGGGWSLAGQTAPLITDLAGNGEIRLVLYNPYSFWSSGFRITDKYGTVLREVPPSATGAIGTLRIAELRQDGRKQIVGIGPVDRVYSSEGELLTERVAWAWSDTPDYSEYRGLQDAASIGVVGSSPVPLIAQRGEVARFYPNIKEAKTVEYSQYVQLLDADLRDLPGWEGGKLLDKGEAIDIQPLIADLTGDGLNEVIVGPTQQGNVRLFGLDGTLISQFKVETEQALVTTAAVADLNQDGINELVYSAAEHLHAVNADGRELPGWPTKIPSPFGDSWKTRIESFAVADLNEDGRPEVIGTSWFSSSLFAIQHDGTALPGWSKSTGWYWVGHKPAVGQVDGSGRQNVVVREPSSRSVYVIDSSGAKAKELTKLMIDGRQTMPVIADVDNDGGNEIVAVDEDGWLFVWDTKGSSCDVNEWPTLGGDLSHSHVYSTPRKAPYVFGCGATLEVKLLDSEGQPISDVLVDGGLLGKRSSDSAGIVRFGGLPLGLSYHFLFNHPAWRLSSLNGVVRGDEAQTVRGSAILVPLYGRVLDSIGRGLEGVVINGGSCGVTTSAPDGGFVLPNVRFGVRCVITASHRGVTFSTSQTIGPIATENQVTLIGTRNRYQLVGRVLMHRKPVGGATIRTSTGGLIRSSRGGYFRVRDIEYGTQVRLTISGKGHKTIRRSIVIDGSKLIAFNVRRR
jgi:subtilisin family serine protease